MFLLCSLCFLLFNFPVLASTLDIITATIVFTNNAANNNTLVVNGETRTFKTQPVATVSTQIGVTNSIGANATNLFNQVAAYPFANNLVLARYGTNGITLSTLIGGSMVASLTGTWGTIALSTQTGPDLHAVRVPMSNMPLPASNRTNDASLLVTALSLYPTNRITAGSISHLNFVDNASTQTALAGDKTWTGTHIFTGISATPIDGSVITASSFAGTNVTASAYIQVADGAFFSTATRGKIKMDSDGVFVLSNDAQTGFTRLDFGGTAATFPALTRSGTTLKVRLADETGNGGLETGTLKIGGGTTIAKVMSATAVLDFGNTTTLLSTDLTITVTGAADGDPVSIGVPAGSVNANSCFTAYVSAADTVTVRFNNYSSGSINPASGTFRAVVTHF